jgi:hypothetical protein
MISNYIPENSQLSRGPKMPRTPQPLHIFRKDVMHLWPETIAVIILFCAYIWAAPSRWTGSEYLVLINVLGFILKAFLMPISWLVLISRLIQDESLVGDRQFWTSRPYHWPSLFAAKILYLVVFLYLPFLLMQIFLLKHAGLYPTTVIPALLYNLLLLTVIVVIPIAAISAVTSTFPRALLSFVIAVIYIIVVILLVVWRVFRSLPAPGLDDVALALMVLLPAIALLYQYATRRTAISRAILIATPLIVALLFFIVPATALIRHVYPVGSQPKLSQLPDNLAPRTPQDGNLVISHGQVQLGLPFTADDADKDSSYSIDGVATTIDAPGVHWSSHYTTGLGMPLVSGSPIDFVPVVIPLDVFNQVGHVPADVHLSVAIHQFKEDPPSTWHATQQPFAVPGHGICSFSAEHPDDPPTSQACGDPSASSVAASADLSSKGTFLDFDPVVSTPMIFKSVGRQPGAPYLLCPGTELTFLDAHEQGKSRLELDEKQILLDNYVTRAVERIHRRPGAPPEPGQQP